MTTGNFGRTGRGFIEPSILCKMTVLAQSLRSDRTEVFWKRDEPFWYCCSIVCFVRDEDFAQPPKRVFDTPPQTGRTVPGMGLQKRTLLPGDLHINDRPQ